MVKIVKNGKSELIFTPNSNVSADGIQRGFFICESTELSMEGGFIKKNRVTALLKVDVKLADELNWKEGQSLTGKIVTTESHLPFYEDQEYKINPTTKEAVLIDGKKVYRQSVYTDNLDLKSVYLVSNTPNKVLDKVFINDNSSALNK